MHRVKHLHSVYFVGGVVYIHLCGMQKTELKVEGVVILIDFLGCSVASEEVIEVIVWAICKSREVLGQMPKSFRETTVERELDTFEWQVFIPSLLSILVLQPSRRTRTGCGLQCMLRRGRNLVDPLWHMYTL